MQSTKPVRITKAIVLSPNFYKAKIPTALIANVMNRVGSRPYLSDTLSKKGRVRPLSKRLIVKAKFKAGNEEPDSCIGIVVSNNGPGIPDAEKPRVIERFYRTDVSRGTPGVGLELSPMAALEILLGGMLQLKDNQPGLSASLIISAMMPNHSMMGEAGKLSTGPAPASLAHS